MTTMTSPIDTNLDCMDVDELFQFHRTCMSTPDSVARSLYPDMSEPPLGVVKLLSVYALDKAYAMLERQKGHIPEALKLEFKCDWLYNTLPTEARW